MKKLLQILADKIIVKFDDSLDTDNYELFTLWWRLGRFLDSFSIMFNIELK